VHAAQRRPFWAFFAAHSAGYELLSQAQTGAPLHPPALQTPMNNLGSLKKADLIGLFMMPANGAAHNPGRDRGAPG
jgi:hypothetical protein